MAVIAASLEHAGLADPEHHVTTERNTQISCIVFKKKNCSDITITDFCSCCFTRIFHEVMMHSNKVSFALSVLFSLGLRE